MDTVIEDRLEVCLAKSAPPEGLLQHSVRTARCSARMLRFYRPYVARLADAVGVDPDEIESRAFAAAYLHDVGKASRSFQELVQRVIRGIRVTGSTPPHALLGMAFGLCIPPLRSSAIPFEALAILSHHASYHKHLYRAGESDWSPLVPANSLLMRAASELLTHLPQLHHEVLQRPMPFSIALSDAETLSRRPCGRLLGHLSERVSQLDPDDQVNRLLFSLFVAVVHHGDWLASGHLDTFRYKPPPVRPRVRHYLRNLARKAQETSSAQSFPLRLAPRVQKHAAKVDGHLQLVAPTGAGKTEAALLWAGRYPERRVIYLLPTRVTSNAMYRRLQKLLGRDTVGLAHGTAALVLSEQDGLKGDEFKAARLHGSTFMRPVTVATVDQLLLSKLNWTYWEMLELAQADSNIIFDEIHAYDLYTLSLIWIAVQQLVLDSSSLHRARIALVSASLPSYVKRIFADLEPAIVTLPSELVSPRHVVEWRDEPIMAFTQEILDHARQGKKVLAIVNTVEEAQELFKRIRAFPAYHDTGLLLLHSRLIEQHRADREEFLRKINQVDGPFIAVTTQIVEVSLDIDFDVLYTQLAPVDALLQRLGRVNRRGLKDPATCVICAPDWERSSRVYGEGDISRGQEILDIALRAMPRGLLSQAAAEEWLAAQYPEQQWLERFKTQLQDIKIRLYNLRQATTPLGTTRLSDEQVKLSLLGTRQGGLLTVEVIPREYAKAAESASPTERLKYQVRVPYYVVREHLRHEAFGYVVNLEYDKDLGLLAESG